MLSYAATCLKILVFSFSLVILEFSIHNFFKTRILLEIFDAEFPCKLSYFEPLCLLNKNGDENREKVYFVCIEQWFMHLKFSC